MTKKGFVNQEYSVAQKGENLKDGTQQTRSAAWVSGSFFSISLIISVSLIAFTIVFFFSPVFGSSMMTTLNANCENYNLYGYSKPGDFSEDSVIVNRFKAPELGDIIVVKFYFLESSTRSDLMTDSKGKYSYFIKRLIAFGGQGVYFRQEPNDLGGNSSCKYKYIIEVDGVPIDESYLDLKWGKNISYDEYYGWQQHPEFKMNGTTQGDVECIWRGNNGESFFKPVLRNGEWRNELVIPEDRMFFMGDNRGGDYYPSDESLKSMDCTVFGPQLSVNLVGTVIESTKKSAPQYVWYKIKQFFSFKWLFS